MTELASISNNTLAVTCDLCGHTGMLPVSLLMDIFGRYADVRHVASRARCSGCMIIGQNTFRITYVGGSGEAMLGADIKAKKLSQFQ
jgi:hypothetical protein